MKAKNGRKMRMMKKKADDGAKRREEEMRGPPSLLRSMIVWLEYG